jgi:hypothetical protein
VPGSDHHRAATGRGQSHRRLAGPAGRLRASPWPRSSLRRN